MAVYHFSAKVISRARGSSAVAAAAYRSASRLMDDRLERAHDFSNKAGVVHSEIIAPEGTPERWQDRGGLWNEVEALEKRKDAQLAREVEFAIPREMSQAEGVELARDFVRREFVEGGMVADLNVHWDVGADGMGKPHAHVMLSMREAGPDGFGKKAREWNAKELLDGSRERWAGLANERLAELGIDARIDHRTLEAQGIALEPQNKIGPAGVRREERGEGAERAVDHREIARRNGERLIAEPGIALDAITRQQSTFTDHDLARFVHRHSDGKEQFDQALSAVRTSPELVALGKDGRGRNRYSTRDMLETEERLETNAQNLADRRSHVVGRDAQDRAIYRAESRGLRLGEGQERALRHVAGGTDVSLVVGYAGSGKSAMLGVARDAWEAAGYQVLGAALSGIAAESLEAGSSIPSRTIASLEHSWGQGRDHLTARDVLVIDEAGMVGSRQMDRVLAAAEYAGAKVVLVGDAEQLQAIEAGAAFRALTERHGAAEIQDIRRQNVIWQREATRLLARGRTDAALERYQGAGMVHAHETRQAAREALVEGWDTVRRASPSTNQIILAHTRVDVADLNVLARARLREAGDLGEDVTLATERGSREFAAGDRIMFLRNERSLGVKNGTLGTLERVDASSLVVRLDGADTGQVSFDLKDYSYIDHGYASTIHKSQGVTVDQTHLLATDGLDRHAAYVGMSRHRDGLAVHYGADDFRSRDQLVETLGRDRPKDTTLDYRQAFAERRNLEPQPEAPARARGMFDGLKLKRNRSGPERDAFEGVRLAPKERSADLAPQRDASSVERALDRYARAWADGARLQAQGLPLLEHQRLTFKAASEELEAVRPFGERDLLSAARNQPGVVRAMNDLTGPARTAALIRGMDEEAKVRLDPELRASRFIKDWTALEQEREGLFRYGDYKAREAVDGRMVELANALKRDPQLESLMRSRKAELGISFGSGLDKVMQAPSVDQALIRDISRGRGLER